MKENVGRKDRIMRSIAGPAFMVAGYTALDGRNGRTAGLATMIFGALIVESAITRVCPLNAALGVDTRENRGLLEKLKREIKRSPKIVD